MSFPLYDILIASVGTNSTNESIDKNKLIKWISQMDQDGHNKIYALIRYHSIKNEDDKSEILPYNAMNNENGDISFEIDKLPNELQKILFEFTKLHMKHMKDNQKIEKMKKNNFYLKK